MHGAVGGVSRGGREPILVDRARLLDLDGGRDTCVDALVHLLGDELLAPERIELELSESVAYQDRGRDREPEKHDREQHTESGWIELALQQVLTHRRAPDSVGIRRRAR